MSTFALLDHAGVVQSFSSAGIIWVSPPALCCLPAAVLVAAVGSLAPWGLQLVEVGVGRTPPSQLAPWEPPGPLRCPGMLSDCVRGAFGGARGWLPGFL